MPHRKIYDAFAGGLNTVDFDIDDAAPLFAEIIERNRAAGFRGCLPSLIFERYSPRSAKLAAAAGELLNSVAKEKRHRCYLRCHIVTRSLSDVKKLLKLIRSHCAVVSVELTSREITAFACRDRRVDLLTLVPGVTRALLRGDISYSLERNKIFELTVNHLLDGETLEVARKLALGRLYTERLTRSKVPVIISTGPRLPYTPVSYRSMLSFIAEVLGVRFDAAARFMGALIESRITENLEKIGGKRPVEGVSIEGKT